MAFPWLDSTPKRDDGETRRAKVATDELSHRAALFYRLGYSEADATARLTARIAWEYDPGAKTGGHHKRPAGLTDDAIGKIVRETYARRPGG
jgi:hypothetical protein